jgi:hypothetical protein
MAKRLATKHKKRRKDQATAFTAAVKSGTVSRGHKVAEERSKKALKKKAFIMN